MQVADKDGLRQIASEEEFKSLVIECGLNQPRTVSLKNLFFYVYPQISVSVLLTLYIITVFIIAFCVCAEM